MYHLQRAKQLEDGVWIEGSFVKQMDGKAAEQEVFIPIKSNETTKKFFPIQTWSLVDRNTVCSFTGKVDWRGEKIWEYDLIRDRFGSIYLVCWNPVQYAYYGILLKRNDGRQVRGCFRMGAFRSSDLERMGSILDQERIEGRWITYFSQWICRMAFYGWFRR